MSRQATEGVNYTSRDYSTIKQDMLDKLTQIMPEYTDRSETDAGIVILELLASALDALHYYNDKVANEMFLSTLMLEENALKWCEILGYSPRSATSAEFMQTFVAPYTIEDREVTKQVEVKDSNGNVRYQDVTVIEPVKVYSDKDITIPKGTIVRTEETTEKESIYFETADDLIIPKGTESATVRIVEGVSQTEVLGVSNGEKAQRYYLKYDSVIKDSVKIYVTKISGEDGVVEVWERVNDFFNSSSTDKHFKVVSWNNTTIVVFGDGSNGMIPPTNTQISADYRVGGGKQGNVEPNTINTIVSVCEAVETYNEDTAFIKGKDAETLDEIKVNAPRNNRTKWGALTLNDFADVVLTHFSEVKFAKALRSEFNADDVDIYVLSEGENPNRINARNKTVDFFVKVKETPEYFSYLDYNGKAVKIKVKDEVKVLNTEPYYYLASEELNIYGLKNVPYSKFAQVYVVTYPYHKYSIGLSPLFTNDYSMYNCISNEWSDFYVYDPIEFNAGNLGNKIAKLFRENPEDTDDYEFGYKVIGTGDVNIHCAKPARLSVFYKLIVGYSYDPQEVDEKVKQAIESYFALGSYPMGQTVYAMDLVKYVMQNVVGVSSFYPTISSLAVNSNGILKVKSNKYTSTVDSETLILDSPNDTLSVNNETLSALDTESGEEISSEGVIPIKEYEVPVIISIDSEII